MSKKTFLAIILGLLVIGGGVYYYSNTADEFEVTVLDEVSELEMELAVLDAQVASGELTPEAATVARANIITKLEYINTQMNASSQVTLSSSQKAQVAEALTRLKTVLVRYSATLDSVDAIAAKDSRTVKSSRSLNSHFLDTVTASETAAAEAEVEVEADMETETALDMVEMSAAETVAEVEAEVMMEDMMSEDENASTTEDGTASTTDETTEDDQAMDEDDTIMIDSSTSVEADTTAESEAQ